MKFSTVISAFALSQTAYSASIPVVSSVPDSEVDATPNSNNGAPSSSAIATSSQPQNPAASSAPVAQASGSVQANISSSPATNAVAPAASTAAASAGSNSKPAYNTTTFFENSSLGLSFDVSDGCNPHLLPTSRQFDTSNKANSNILAHSVDKIHQYASKHDYGLALLQWYNATGNIQSSHALVQNVIDDIDSLAKQPSNTQGLKCLLKSLEASPSTTNETQQVINKLEKEINGYEAFVGGKNNSTSSKNSSIGNRMAYVAASQCQAASQAPAEDCQIAITQLNNLKVDGGNFKQQQVQSGNCIIVTENKNSATIQEIQQAATELIGKCANASTVGGTAHKSWGKVCISDRATGC